MIHRNLVVWPLPALERKYRCDYVCQSEAVDSEIICRYFCENSSYFCIKTQVIMFIFFPAIRARLFKAMKRSFCTAKASHIFSTKNIGVFEILTFEILTRR